MSFNVTTSVSVIMPALNADRFITAAIDSLLRERDTINLDIIVIDDGSTDRTREIVEKYAAQFAQVRMLRNPRKGIAAARNTGLENLHPDCAFIAFLDADDVSYPGRLARQRSILVGDPEIDVLYGRVQMFSIFDTAALAPKAGSRTKIIRGPYLQSAMYRPHVFKQVGRFDESFRQGDDTDFILRVVESGSKLILDDGIAAYYRRHDANVTLNTKQMQREFMLASLKWAARNRLKGRGELPHLFSQLFLRRDEIEKDFEA
jgi:glycosyltransferase involved in cell wall biosynthesis